MATNPKSIDRRPGRWVRLKISEAAKERLVMLTAMKTVERGTRQNSEVIASEFFEDSIREKMP